MTEIPNVIGGDTATAAWANDVKNRTAMRYATAAARDLVHCGRSTRTEVYNPATRPYLQTQIAICLEFCRELALYAERHKTVGEDRAEYFLANTA